MTPERWTQLQAVFNEVVEHPVTQRASVLAAACKGDEELRHEVEELLAIDQEGDTALRDAIGGAMANVVDGQRSKLLGAVIGQYRIKRILGHGGMGTVFLGERDDKQFQQRVAIKLVEQMALHPQMRTRLRSERQILAHLEHPYVARLIDGGETKEGIPYLVIEYVEGKPIDEYCNDNKLTIAQRLALFEKVCTAVNYAHRHLIVHRDIKPANILVTADGTPKLLDFGIAKIISSDTVGTAAVTRVQDRMLTPEHASPEQVLGRPITTATDIYALGVLLYHLVANRSPYANSNSTSIGLQRAICNEDPPRPSGLFRSTEVIAGANDQFDPVAIAARYDTTPQRLRRQLAGDVDEIILKAMRKEPEQRYASAEQIIEDLRRQRTGQPIMASQGGRRYRAIKFVRRNSLSVSLGVVVACSLIGFAAIMGMNAKRMAVQRDLADKAKNQAEQVSTFLVDIFSATDPFKAQGREITAKELLDQGAARIQSELTQVPEVRAQMLDSIGYAYQRQSLPDRAIPLLEQSLEIRQKIYKNALSEQVATSMFNLATALHASGKRASAEGYYRQALTMNRQIFGEDHERVAQVMSELGRLLLEGNSNLDEAEHLLKRGRDIYSHRLGKETEEVARTLLQLGHVALWRDNPAAAENYLREAFRICQLRFPRTHPSCIHTLGSLGMTLSKLGKLDEAEGLLKEALELQRKVFGPMNSQVPSALQALSSLYEQRRKYPEAIALLEEAVIILKKTMGESHWETGYDYDSLGKLYFKSGMLDKAETNTERALRIFKEALPADHLYTASSQHTLGEILLAEGKYAAAEEPLRDAVDICGRAAGTSSWRTARSENTLGMVLLKMNRRQEAESLLRTSYETLNRTLGGKDELTKLARQRLASL